MLKMCFKDFEEVLDTKNFSMVASNVMDNSPFNFGFIKLEIVARQYPLGIKSNVIEGYSYFRISHSVIDFGHLSKIVRD